MEQINEKKFLVLKIIAFESETRNSDNPKQDTCHCQSMFYEQPLWFNILLRGLFFKSGSLGVMEKHDESALMMILQEFGTL